MTLTAESAPHAITIRRAGQSAPLLVQRADPDLRPFIHPIAVPDGDGTLTEDAPPHHKWQHGLYVGLNGINGFGFWTEGLRGDPKDGTFHPRPLGSASVGADRAAWTVVADWRAPDRGPLLTEIQSWTLHDRGNSLELDLSWTLIAAVDLTFAKYAYGGLFVRMPYRDQAKDRAAVLTSEGVSTQTAAEAQRARWVAIAIAIPDRHAADDRASLVMMDHPANAEHPSPWRVDGQLGIAPSRCIAGPWTLAAGASTTARYRVLVHPGPIDPSAAAASWDRFIA
ncbi:hypothetical protein LBMAG53_27300 [Planctomycetota bacterium]|nr:hypothetical protein LBMAG53_27300 [Planctomycetota bacterium]